MGVHHEHDHSHHHPRRIHDEAHPHHAHAHGHHHGAVGNIKVAFFINLTFTLVELVGGVMTNSMAILTDSLHDFGDTVALGLAWYLEKLAARQSDQQFTFGYARFSVLGAFLNSLILIGGSIFILTQTIPRLMAPEAADAKGMLYLAILGVVFNGFAAWRLSRGNTLNERAVALHMLEDVLGWAAIIIGSVVMLLVDIPILDPILSMLIMGYILFNVFRNLRRSLRIFLQGIPSSIDFEEVEAQLEEIPGVEDIHDMHLWTLDGEYHIASLHVAMAKSASLEDAERIKAQIRARLKEMGVEHATIEVESEDYDCSYQDCT